MVLWGDQPARLPGWLDGVVRVRYRVAHIFGPELPAGLGLAPLAGGHPELPVSVPERALLELFGETGSNKNLEGVRQLVESIRNLWLPPLGGLHHHCRSELVGLRGGPVVHEGVGFRVSGNVLGHRFALGPDAGAQSIHGAHRTGHSHDTSATALPAAYGEGRTQLLSGLIGWGHDSSSSRQPHGLARIDNRRFTIALLGCQSLALAIKPPGLPRQPRRARADASRCAALATLARRRLHRGSTAGSFASSAMAATPLSRTCPIRIISVQLLVAPGFRGAVAAGQLLRVLFLDREGHIAAQPHYLPRGEALILAANQQRVLGAQARVQVL